MKILYIINETAGAGRAATVWRQLTNLHPDIEAHGAKTSAAGDGTPIAASAADRGYDAVVAVGGDGTLNEALNGIIQSGRDVALGQIPCGTGNDFARSIGLSRKPETALALCQAGNTVLTDIGMINRRAFINVAGFGFDAAVAQDVINRSESKKVRGTIPYLFSVFRLLRTYRPSMMEIQLDGETKRQPVFLGAVGNGSTYGGGMRICPDAQVDDGMFSVCLAGDVSRREALFTIVRVFRGKHTNHPKCSFPVARKVTVHGPAEVLVHADGQMVGTLPVTMEIKPLAIRFLRLER